MSKLRLDVKEVAKNKVTDNFEKLLWNAKNVLEIVKILEHSGRRAWEKRPLIKKGVFRLEGIAGHFFSSRFNVAVNLSFIRTKKGRELDFSMTCEYRKWKDQESGDFWKRKVSIHKGDNVSWDGALKFFRKCHQ